jgi:alkyl sulfatase BDS1-like metallo-beta-lactamase superfamily hydrolase
MEFHPETGQYTLRGDKVRYVQWYLDGLQRVLDLQPELLVTGHGDPVRGAAEIARQVQRIGAATKYVKDRTWEGMNADVDLWTLMADIKLPPELAIGQGHGKVPWMVRAIWEEHLGWFRYESTTEFYHVPSRAVAPDLVELAGGPEPVLARAGQHRAAGCPLEAMHLAEAVLAAARKLKAALTIRLKATQLLLAQSTRENFSETRWLEAEVRHLQAAIAGASA